MSTKLALCMVLASAGLCTSYSYADTETRLELVSDDRFMYAGHGSEIVLDVFANDAIASIGGVDAVITEVISDTAHGAIVNLGHAIAYKPPSEFRGVDSFSYVASGGNGLSASGRVSVRVGALEIFNIMPMGGSVIEGQSPYNSHRRALWHLLNDTGFDVDFVGTKSGVRNGPPPNPDFDSDHEGYWGWRIDQFLANDLIDSIAQSNPPDVVLLYFGTNDLTQGQSVASTIADLDQIVAAFRAVVPDVIIVVGRPYRSVNLGVVLHAAYSAAIVDYVATVTTIESPIVSVDHAAGFDTAVDTYDGSHPNVGGEAKMADTWYQEFAPLINEGPALDSAIPDVSVASNADVQIELSPYFSDPEAQVLSFYVVGLPMNLRFDPSSGAISGLASTVGTAAITVIVTDLFGDTVEASFSLVVTAEPGSTKPKLVGTGSFGNSPVFLILLSILAGRRWISSRVATFKKS